MSAEREQGQLHLRYDWPVRISSTWIAARRAPTDYKSIAHTQQSSSNQSRSSLPFLFEADDAVWPGWPSGSEVRTITKENCQSSGKPIRSTATRRATLLFKGPETRHFVGKGAGRGAQHRLALWPRAGCARQQAVTRGRHVFDRVPLVLAALALGVLASLVLGHKLAVERQEAIAQLLLQLCSELR